MDKILKFLDFSCIDPRLYWRISSLDGKKVYEIQWQREGSVHWRLREVGALFWDLSTEDTLVADLEQRQIDVYLFEMKLKNTLLQQVTYASRIVEDAKKIFGKAEVEQSIREQENFLVQLQDALVKLTEAKKPSRPQLRVLRSEHQA